MRDGEKWRERMSIKRSQGLCCRTKGQFREWERWFEMEHLDSIIVAMCLWAAVLLILMMISPSMPLEPTYRMRIYLLFSREPQLREKAQILGKYSICKNKSLQFQVLLSLMKNPCVSLYSGINSVLLLHGALTLPIKDIYLLLTLPKKVFLKC